MALQPNTIPKDGFAGTGMGANYNTQVSTEGANASTAAFPLGTKVRYYNSDLDGYGTCIYLRVNVSGSESAALAAGSPVGVDEGADEAYRVTSDQSAIADGAPTAIALSGMTDDYYGWFWCGGVCPDLTTLVSTTETRMKSVTCATDNSVAAGKGVQLALSTTDNILVVATTSAVISKVGFALADDGGVTTDMGNLVLFDNWG